MQPLKWEFRSNIWYYMWKKNLISKRIHLNIQSGRSRQPDLRLTDLIWSRTESQKCSTFEACSWPCQKWGGRLNEIFPKFRRSNALGDKTRQWKQGCLGRHFFRQGGAQWGLWRSSGCMDQNQVSTRWPVSTIWSCFF